MLNARCVVTVLAVGLVGAIARAADEVPQEIGDFDLDVLLAEPIVTGNGGRPTTRALGPANIVIVGRAEIQRRGWRSLAEVFSNVVGLYVIDDQVNPSVSVRGVSGGLRSGTRIIKVMINGVAVSFRPDSNAFIGEEFLPIDSIQTIEIAKGPLSSLYGANAFLATVNVITRRSEEGTRIELIGEGRLLHGDKTGYGAGVVATHAQPGADLLVAMRGASIDRSGLEIPRTFDSQSSSTGYFADFFASASRRDVAKPRSLYVNLNLENDFFGKFSAQAGRQVMSSSAEFQPNSVLTHRSRIAITNDYASASLARSFGSTTNVRITGGWAHGAPTDAETLVATGDDGYSYRRNFGYTAFDLAAVANVELPFDATLTAGADYTNDREDALYYTRYATPDGSGAGEKLIGSERRQLTFENAGAFVQLAGDPGALHWSGNLRVDAPEFFDLQVSWRAHLAYELSNRLVAKLFVGHAFQTPSPVMMFAVSGFGASSNVVGNRNQASFAALKPQAVSSAELVLNALVTAGVALEGALYAQHVTDKIEFVQLSTDFTGRNLGSQNVLGAELSCELTLGRFGAHVSGTTQMTSSSDDPLLTQRRGDGLSFDAPSLFPVFSAFADVRAQVPEAYLLLDASMRAFGERGSSESNAYFNSRNAYTLPAYAMFDVSVSSLGLHPLGRETVIAARVRNVFDNRYADPGFSGFDLPALGRTWMLSLTQVL